MNKRSHTSKVQVKGRRNNEIYGANDKIDNRGRSCP